MRTGASRDSTAIWVGFHKASPRIRPQHSCRCLAVGCRPVMVMAPAVCEPLQPRTGRDESRLVRFLAHLQALRQRTPVTSLRELHALHGPVQ